MEFDSETEGSSLAIQMSAEDNILDEWLTRPLELNAARERDLVQLPGVDRPLARRILRERRRRGRFGSVDQLMGIPGVGSELLKNIRPFVRAGPLDISRFSGDTRFRIRNVNPRGTTILNADPGFRNNTYLYNRTRLRHGGRAQAGWVARRASVGPGLTPENIAETSLIKYSVMVQDTAPVQRFIVGDFALTTGQGLLFYGGLGEFVRPVKVKDVGAELDFSSSPNAYLRGAVMEVRAGRIRSALFVSEKALDLQISSSTGRGDQDLNDLRNNLGELQDEEDLRNQNTLTERLAGGRLVFEGDEYRALGVTGYLSRYDPVVDPVQTGFADAHVFRGNENVVGALDFDVFRGPLNVFGEYARSRSQGPGVQPRHGSAWTVTPLVTVQPFHGWISLFDYDAHFFARHGKGVSFAVAGPPEDLTDNQRGALLGFGARTSRLESRVNYGVASFPRSLGTGAGTLPVQASAGRHLYMDALYSASSTTDLYIRHQLLTQDAYQALVSGGHKQQVERRVQKTRAQIAWKPGAAIRYRLRYETRVEDVAQDTRLHTGHLVMGEVTYRWDKDLSVQARLYAFDSPEASLSAGTEEIWRNVQYYRLAGGLQDLEGTPGTRFYLILKQAVGDRVDLWLKYDVNHRPGDLARIGTSQADQQARAFSAVRHGFHAQLDYRWGNE